ncbi:MAG: hypothetical protein IJ381_08485 [Clostridia bacterium]|nr:hypothetical protein [Clostridia bacterium]
MKKLLNGKIVELTADEITEMHREQGRAAVQERKRPLSENEVLSMLLRQSVNTITVDDQTALRMMDYYPAFAAGMTVSTGDKLTYGGKLYRVITGHTTQADWTPDVTASLFVRIDEEHDGSEFDPIPYEGNMALENGKYYTQGGVTYLCTRDTGAAVYQALSELVGLYVEVVTV